MFFRLLCVGLCLGTVSANEDFKKDWMEWVVNTFNLVFHKTDLAIPSYDFGSGVPLLHGPAKIFIAIPLSLTESSYEAVDGGTLYIFQLYLPIVLIPPSQGQELWLMGCNMELQYAAYRGNGRYVSKPTKLWIDRCSSMVFDNKTGVPQGEQVLPLVSEALLVTAQDQLSYSSNSTPPIDQSEMWKTFRNVALGSVLYS